MLNCTDFECILHHHHYNHHENRLQHHLQDNRAHHEHHHVVMSGDTADRQHHEPDTLNITADDDGIWEPQDSELQSSSHVDDPNETLYMVCGVLIAMVLVGIIIVLLAVTISKLRKREDTLPTTTTATPPAATTTTPANHNHNNNVIQHSNNHIISNGIQQQQNNNTCSQQVTDVIDGPAPPFLWVYHTNGTSTTNSSQYTLYNNDQDTLVHNLQCEEARECKGFRKNLRGKWRRLVKKKPQQEVYTIPAELRDQLKQIYVY
ncbi:hypothetical protein LSTR_LSTR009671 [Laodelphax striatellus]|uniref:Uncharacterized protein n=1 Tax=Laodelphax striatellus TaxID=195883 RepID=A0A482WND8_LAOST|nr:hypothetical protein LSTR_LSTR009671 [Laodelphax striatellus]